MTDEKNNVPGNLAWKPSTEVLELLATPVAEVIASVGFETMAAPIDADLADTATFCEAYDVQLAESANCVIVEGRRGERTTLAAVLVLATDRADVNKTIKKHLDVRKISFAPMDTATSLTGMEYGGITPIGLPAEWSILIDEKVAEASWVVIGSGIRGSKIAVRGTDLAGLPGVEVLPLAL